MTTNPFKRNRAEQMGETTWKYFVKDPFGDLLSEKPLIFEGSRGCGKTMFFLCNSWKEKIAEYNEKKIDVTNLFKSTSFIGFYYKVDGRFVGKNLSGKGIEDWEWQTVFNTYFNVIITKEILSFVTYCVEYKYLERDLISNLLKKIKAKTGITGNDLDIKSTIDQLDNILDEIECFSNDPEKKKPLGLHAGTLILSLVEELRKISLFSEARFHVFIDEFEELNISQQKQLNTLIKQSKYWLVYDIGVKTKGRYSEETISGEIIREPDDYKHYYPEIDSYERKDEYEKLLFSISKKRLEDCLPEPLKSVPEFLDINYYLKDYGKEVELEEFSSSPRFASIQNRLKRIIEEENNLKHYYSKSELSDVISLLTQCSPDLVRMHISLLNRKAKISIKELFENAKNSSKKYNDWKHNMLFATYFLLCKELDIIKKYHGLATFSMLSSGVIRSFLEICESAFDYAFSKGFSFTEPRSLTLEEQTSAAHYVSQSKVSKIEGFVPDGMLLKRFMLALGKIFYSKHTDPNATLGEPEPNHFYTKTLELRSSYPEAMRMLENALMHNVLQFDLPTKEKNDAIETTDYHINHIYCPFFKISHRRKRKIYLEPIELKTLLIGSTIDVDKIVKVLVSKSHSETKQGQLNFNDDGLSGEI